MGRIGDAFGSVRGWLRGHPGVVRGFALGVVAFITLIAGLAIGSWRAVCRDCPSVAQIYAWEPKQSTQIFAPYASNVLSRASGLSVNANVYERPSSLVSHDSASIGSIW